MAALRGFTHIALTVTNLARSKDWYGRVLDWKPVLDGDGDGVVFCVGALPDGSLLGLRQYETGSGDGFDPMRTGLDHVALAAASVADLPDWERRFEELGVTYSATQHTPFGDVLNFKDPDGIALEVFAAPEQAMDTAAT